MSRAEIETTCCIAGGGPAGMMLGYLLARAGIDVVVLEKHADFLRDFRGDTVHPSTLQLFHELGLLDAFLKLPHERTATFTADLGGERFTIADFTHLPVMCKFLAFVPQWDLLNFVAEQGRRYPGFHLKMQHAAMDLIEASGRVVGVRASGPQGDVTIRARLVVGADGRTSRMRRAAGLAVEDQGAPMDALWFRLPHHAGDRNQTGGRFAPGAVFVNIFRGDYWQCAYVIPKGGAEALKAQGLDAFRQRVAMVAPDFADRIDAIQSLDDVKLLTVTVDRLKRWWKPGLLCIGDAAHAMSPVGGVGINLAIQDAVAAANALATPLGRGDVLEPVLARIEKRRRWPASVIQWVQIQIQNVILKPTLDASATAQIKPPLMFRVLAALPVLQRLPARLIGLGVRREHIRTPDVLGADMKKAPT